MKYVTEIVNRGLLRATVRDELKTLGIKAPKCRKTSMKQDPKTNGKVFGTPINHLPSVVVDEDKHMKIPKFFATILSSLENGIEAEGLFRKAGSVMRQREIRKMVEKGLMDFDLTPAHDLASLVKQFLRELPEPLVISRLHDSFLKAQSFGEDKRLKCIVLLCLLLPVENINLLRYVMSFLKRLASFNEKNKMDVHNLALIMAPNLMQLVEKNDKCGKTLESQIGIISILIRHADEIGLIPCEIDEKMSSSDCGDEMVGSNSYESITAKSKRRNSLNGVLHSIRKRAAHRALLADAKEQAPPLALYNDFSDSPLADSTKKLEKRNSSKRKADKDESLVTPIKKRLMSENCEPRFPTPAVQFGFNKTIQSHPDAVCRSENAFFVNTPNLSFANPCANVFTPTENASKTPKTKQSKYKRFFSPAKLIRRQKCCATAANSAISLHEFADTSGCHQLETKMAPAHFKCSTVPLINFANPHVVPFGICNNDENLEEPVPINDENEPQVSNVAYEMLAYAMKRRSLTDTDLCRVLEDATSPTCKKRVVPVKTKSLRRGQPNTVRTGLPLTSPFKSCEKENRMTTNFIETRTSCNGIKPMVVIDCAPSPQVERVRRSLEFDVKIKIKPMVVQVDSKIEPDWENNVEKTWNEAENDENFYEKMEEIAEMSENEYIATENLEKSPGNLENDYKPAKKLEQSPEILKNGYKTPEKLVKTSKNGENKRETSEKLVKTPQNEENEHKTTGKLVKTPQNGENKRETFEKLVKTPQNGENEHKTTGKLLKSSQNEHKTTGKLLKPSQNEYKTMEKHGKLAKNEEDPGLTPVYKRLSFSQPDIRVNSRKSNSPRTCVPLTNKTRNMLAHAGFARDEGSPNESTDQQEAWRSENAIDEEFALSCTRPSLLMIKTERAGVVSENIKKYNAITRNETKAPKTPRSHRAAVKTPAKTDEKSCSVRSSSFSTPTGGAASRCNSFSAIPKASVPRVAALRSVSSTPTLAGTRWPLKPRNEVFKTPQMLPKTTPKSQRTWSKCSVARANVQSPFIMTK